ncbi:MAG TPA: SDR family oxidoreductase [Candidatus Lokiarchaeia archaeon]|nr:SDR family oxidoreductase [Candidatus Lokiarchaeia archaeon]
MAKKQDPKVIFITGCSSGFGYLATKELARCGHKVYASMRDISSRNEAKKTELESFAADNKLFLKVLECNVTDTGSVEAAIKTVIDDENRIDVLVNNAGYGIYGPLEFYDDERARDAFETNVYGYIRTIRAVMPQMRKQRSGLIINVSSVLGRVGLPIMGFYNATKFAVEGLSESLLGECYLFNINVSVVEPYMFATNFAGPSAKMMAEPDSTSEYKGAFHALLEKQGNLINPKSGPDEVVRKIAWLVGKKNPPFRVPVGKHARRDMLFASFMNPLTLQKIAAKLYGLGDAFKKM